MFDFKNTISRALKSAAVAATALIGSSVSAYAETLLSVDLSVLNQITVSATDGASAVTVDGSDTTGFYLDGIFNTPISFSDTFVSGDLTSALNVSDGGAILFNPSAAATGINIFGSAIGPMLSFEVGQTAFSGSATWTIDAAAYAAALAGPLTGSIFFPADTPDDLANAPVLGSWERSDMVPVPLPAAGWMLLAGLSGMAAMKRRKRAS